MRLHLVVELLVGLDGEFGGGVALVGLAVSEVIVEGLLSDAVDGYLSVVDGCLGLDVV